MVSIHAPVKGATYNPTTKETMLNVSIHAPVKGATVLGAGCVKSQSFNSRTRKGCDIPSGITMPTTPVSIHAPVKGATIAQH